MAICYQDLQLLHYPIVLYIYDRLLKLKFENISKIAEATCFMQETFALCKLDGWQMLLILVTREQNQVINFPWSVGCTVQSETNTHTYVRNNGIDLIWHTLKLRNYWQKRIYSRLVHCESLSLFDIILIIFLIILLLLQFNKPKKLRLNDNDILITMLMRNNVDEKLCGLQQRLAVFLTNK